jgi:nicotinamidase-related amidase
MESYLPDFVSKKDLETMRKAGWTQKRMGFGKKVAVLVIDVTRAFAEDCFSLSCGEMAQPVIKAIKKLLSVARSKKIPVIYTKKSLMKTEVEWGRWLDKGLDLDVLSNEKSGEIVEDVKPAKNDIVVTKEKPSAFFGTELASLLLYLGVDTLLVTGMTTSGCVRATVVDAFSYNFRAIIPLECVGDRVDISHKTSLFDMGSKYADVMSLSEILAYLKKL